MAYLALESENGDLAELTREDFTIIADEDTGQYTLVIPRIVVELYSEQLCDELADQITNEIFRAELWSRHGIA